MRLFVFAEGCVTPFCNVLAFTLSCLKRRIVGLGDVLLPKLDVIVSGAVHCKAHCMSAAGTA